MRSWKYSVSTATVLLALSATGPVTANLSDDKNLAPSTHDVPIVAWSLGEPMLLAQANQAKEKEKSGKNKNQAQKAQGYQKSGNPKAAGGPQNPGKGKPQKPSNAQPEQPVERPKPEQPVEAVKPEQPVAPPQPEPRDKDGRG
jgi:outer membrane biosynthesis protein TonB